MCLLVCACTPAWARFYPLFANAPRLRKQRISVLLLFPSFLPPRKKKLILILNVCSGSRSGQVRDCLLFPPSGHLKLHLIQMPICSTQIGRGWSQLPGWLACLGVLCTPSTKACVRLLRVCARVSSSCMRVYTGPSQLGASIIGEQGASGGVGLSVTV